MLTRYYQCLGDRTGAAVRCVPRTRSPDGRGSCVSEAGQLLMRRIDELLMEIPFAGARMLARLLRREGHEIGRRRVRKLMKRMASRRCTESRTRADAMRSARSGRICCRE